MEKTRKVGIMGGTFDPIHIGHLMIADRAYEQLGLDQVLFMPAGKPPHKRNRKDKATDEQRVEMVRRAIASHPGFELSLFEMEKEGYSFTYETLEALNKANPDTEYYFIIGADSLYDLKDWREPARICAGAVIVVAIRNSSNRKLLEYEVRLNEENLGGRFVLLDMDSIDVSSTAIRQWVERGRSIRYFVPDGVMEHILEQKIYQKKEEK